MKLPVKGGCLCGNVRYQITEKPEASAICHCVTCRRAAGAESVGWAVLPVGAFGFTSGQPKKYCSSEGVERTFCGRCGTTLTYKISVQTIDFTLATLDDPEAIPPTKEVWCEARVSWNVQNADLVQCAQDK